MRKLVLIVNTDAYFGKMLLSDWVSEKVTSREAIASNNVIILGVFSLELTKLYSEDVNIFFSFVNKFCCFVAFFLVLNI